MSSQSGGSHHDECIQKLINVLENMMIDSDKNNKKKDRINQGPINDPSAASSSEEASSLFNLCGLISKAGGSEGLSRMPKETLRHILDPVMKSLEQLDAEALLDLKRVTQGARLCDGVNVQPIHNDVVPRYDTPCVRYLHISEVADQYSIGIFIFPPFAKIPLHDHPGMCVLSRLLYGDLQRLSLDLVKEEEDEVAVDSPDAGSSNNNNSSSSWSNFFRLSGGQHNNKQRNRKNLPPGARKALKNNVSHLHAPAVTILYPYEGNIHEFFAGPHGACLLDILLPPYQVETGRDCTFFDFCDEDQQQQTQDNDAEDTKTPCWIYPTNQPEEFHCLSGTFGKLGGGSHVTNTTTEEMM